MLKMQTLFTTLFIACALNSMSVLGMQNHQHGPHKFATKADVHQQQLQQQQVLQYLQDMRLKLLHDRFKEFSSFSTAKQIVQNNERKELQIHWLCKAIDNSQTVLGGWALQKHLEQPITDVKAIVERQELITLFAQDLALQDSIKNYMSLLRYTQNDLIDHVTGMDEILRKDTASLYYVLPWGIGDYLNTKRVALDGVMLYELGKSTSYLLGLLGFEGVQAGLFQMALRKDGKFAPLEWLANGLREPLDNINFWQAKRTKDWEKPENGRQKKEVDWADYWEAVNQGTLYDRCYALTHGLERKVEIDLPAPDFIKRGLKRFFEGQTRAISATTAIPIGITFSAVKYALRFMAIRSSYYQLTSTQKKMEQAHRFMIRVAQFMRVMQNLARTLINHPHISKTFLGKTLQKLFNPASYSEDLKELFELLNTATFNLSGEQSLLYSRGRILLAYKLLDKTMGELLPMLRAMGLIDMYSSLAWQVNDAEHPWTFVEFVESQEPVFVLNEYKTPVYRNAVSNSVAFGQGQPTKMLITGPNMGGKSAVLRLILGQSSVLAQSIGIVPAQSMKMTAFDEILTSLNPQEDMARGISKFMAVNMSMRRVYQEIERFEPNKQYLILIDEPFDGTVDEETARRTGELLEWSTNKKNVIITIATHILPQIKKENQALFNYQHVEILEPQPGNFVRTHKLKAGIDTAWFHDHARRRRYIDWLGNHRIVGHMPPQAPETLAKERAELPKKPGLPIPAKPTLF